MLLDKAACVCPRSMHEVTDRREIPATPYAVLNGLAGEKKYMEHVRCKLCGRVWWRHEDAGAEDI